LVSAIGRNLRLTLGRQSSTSGRHAFKRPHSSQGRLEFSARYNHHACRIANLARRVGGLMSADHRMMVGTSSRDGHRLVSKGRPKSEEKATVMSRSFFMLGKD
jgi:hypothetical protein